MQVVPSKIFQLINLFAWNAFMISVHPSFVNNNYLSCIFQILYISLHPVISNIILEQAQNLTLLNGNNRIRQGQSGAWVIILHELCKNIDGKRYKMIAVLRRYSIPDIYSNWSIWLFKCIVQSLSETGCHNGKFRPVQAKWMWAQAPEWLSEFYIVCSDYLLLVASEFFTMEWIWGLF